MEYLEKTVAEAFAWQPFESSPKGRLLDIGGGTGNFTRCLLPYVDRAVIVDPFLSASDESDDTRIEFVSAAAEAFAVDEDATALSASAMPDWRTNYDYILLKEVVHHLDNRVTLFRGLHKSLNESIDNENKPQNPQLLLITRPQTDLDYPLWPAALDVWAQNQPSAAQLTEELHQAGFIRTATTVHDYPCQISLTAWQGMVQRRFWSTFSHFTDEELQAACADMSVTQADRLHDNGTTLRFEDRLVFIRAWK